MEDETNVANVVVWQRIYETFRTAVISGRLLRITGRIEREGQVIHLIAEHVEDLSPMLSTLGSPAGPDPDDGTDGAETPNRGRASSAAKHPREQAKKLFPSRDFH